MKTTTQRFILSWSFLCWIGLIGFCFAEQSPTPDIDPQAVTALKEMGAYLRTLQSFTVQADTVKDEVMESGQALQFGSRVAFSVQQPNRLRVDIDSDRQSRHFYFDGQRFTLYGPRLKFYATVPASGTINELLRMADDRYGIEIPLADLFYWGSEGQSDIDLLTGASAIGQARIGTAVCDHYAFRQVGIDWQLWIERGSHRLPRKLVITTTDEESRPQFAALFTWNLKPKFDKTRFRFVPPKDALPVTLVEIDKSDAAPK